MGHLDIEDMTLRYAILNQIPTGEAWQRIRAAISDLGRSAAASYEALSDALHDFGDGIDTTPKERTPTMRTLDDYGRKTIRIAMDLYECDRLLSYDEVRAVLAHYGLIAPAAPVEQPAAEVVEETPDQPAPLWEVGDRFRWENRDKEIGTIEAFNPMDSTRVHVRWDSGGTSENSLIVDGTYPCTKLPPVEAPAPEPRFQVGDRVRHSNWGEGVVREDDGSDTIPYRVSFSHTTYGADFWQWCSAKHLTLIDDTPAAPAWHVGQRVRWKSDGDLGTVVAVEDGNPRVRFDGWRPDNSMLVGSDEISEGLLEPAPETSPAAPLAVGDRVRDGHGDYGIIVGTYEDRAWVKYDLDRSDTPYLLDMWRFEDLTRL